MKTIREVLEEALPEEYFELAMKYDAPHKADKSPFYFDQGYSPAYACLDYAFDWADTDEGYMFWRRVYEYLTNELPPIPKKGGE